MSITSSYTNSFIYNINMTEYELDTEPVSQTSTTEITIDDIKQIDATNPQQVQAILTYLQQRIHILILQNNELRNEIQQKKTIVHSP
jgi:hypothetical protein